MKTYLLSFLILLPLLTPTAAFAASASRHVASDAGTPHSFGLGIVLGDPTAITGKFWLPEDRAADVGFSFFSNNFLLVYGDYLFHFAHSLGNSSAFVSQLSPYVGVGGELIFFQSNYYSNGEYYRTTSNSSSIGLGIRVPLGIEWIPARAPIGVFVEIVPGVLIIPGTFGLVQAGIGVRYYF